MGRVKYIKEIIEFMFQSDLVNLNPDGKSKVYQRNYWIHVSIRFSDLEQVLTQLSPRALLLFQSG